MSNYLNCVANSENAFVFDIIKTHKNVQMNVYELNAAFICLNIMRLNVATGGSAVWSLFPRSLGFA